MDLGIKDKVAVVVGTKSIGRAVALELGLEGAKVLAHYNRSAGEAEEVVSELKAKGREALAFKADASKESEVNAMFERAVAAFGAVDILVHVAGVWPTSAVVDMTLEQWEECMRVNMTSVFLTNRWLVRHLRERNAPGSILNYTSQAAFLGSTTFHAHYSAAKAAVVAFTISLAREMAPYGIRVNSIAPGLCYSYMGGDGIPYEGAKPEAEEYYKTRIPMKRIATAEEIAHAAVFAVSDRNTYMTGATINVSGGMLMR